jgi:hypothetical protein
MGDAAKGRRGGCRWWGEDFGELSRVAPERPISLRSAYGLYGPIGGQCRHARRAVVPRMW